MSNGLATCKPLRKRRPPLGTAPANYGVFFLLVFFFVLAYNNVNY